MQSFVAQFLTCLTLLRGTFSSPVSPLGSRAVVVDDASKLNPSYDYVVIGGGTSGLVVANRLTEDPGITVLVVEYGYVDAQDGGTSVSGLPVPSKYRRDYTSIPKPGLDGCTTPIYTGAVAITTHGGKLGNGTPVTQTAKACKEIILAAGAPHSPQLLQLSGIGPKKLLAGLSIKTIVDHPGVGRNFQDQVSMFPQWTYSIYPFPSPDWLISNQSWADEQLAVYYKNRTGPDTIPYFSGSIVLFLPLQNVTPTYQSIIESASAVHPTTLFPNDIDPTLIAGYKAQTAQMLNLYSSAHATVEEVAWAGGDTVSLALLKPLSRGVITINTTDPTAPPVFDYGTFTHPTDIDVAVQSFKKLRAFMSSGPMLETGAVETFPGANVSTDAQIAAAICGFATSTWAHPTCSCAMMPLELGGMVDSQLRVHGVTGLRIVDALIMPMIPGSLTSSTVYAVAEKAADIIKAAASGWR